MSGTVSAEILGFLGSLGASENPHSGRTLTQHLIGTHDQLLAWGNPPEVCLAGLFHSIYGTQAYVVSTASFEDRARVAAVIGEAAETLAWRFCVADRRHLLANTSSGAPLSFRNHLTGEVSALEEPMFRQLCEIELANILDQLPPAQTVSEAQREAWRQRFGVMRPFVSTAAWVTFEAWFGPSPQSASNPDVL